jgi:hypothetical protein
MTMRKYVNNIPVTMIPDVPGIKWLYEKNHYYVCDSFKQEFYRELEKTVKYYDGE